MQQISINFPEIRILRDGSLTECGEQRFVIHQHCRSVSLATRILYHITHCRGWTNVYNYT